VAVLGEGKKIVGFTLSLMTWASHLTLITNDPINQLNDEERAKLADFDIAILNRRIARLDGEVETGGIERVQFEEGDALPCDALFFNLGNEPSSNLHTMLGCRLDEESGLVWVDSEQQTSVPGVFAVGDLTPHSQLAVVAAVEGGMAAIHVHNSLLPRERRF
jgi:thioredoxin reductase